MDLVSIVGARPQFVKAAPVARAVERHNATHGEPIEHRLLHTGQHYDDEMSELFFRELELPPPVVNLELGGGSHAEQTGRMMVAIESYLLGRPPDVVLVYGDTNSTLAGALAAVKLGLPVAHLEAGLRSFNRRMPEEINRIVADCVSDLLLAPTGTAMENLEREGLGGKAELTGDVMYDAVLAAEQAAGERSRALERFSLVPGGYALATIHRAENTDAPGILASLLRALEAVAESVAPVLLLLHPRTRLALERQRPEWSPAGGLQLAEPAGYGDMLCLVRDAKVVLTDSGGVQKEAFFLGRPCVTLRRETEWLETVEAGWNIVAGSDAAGVLAAARSLAARFPPGCPPAGAGGGPFGDGRAAEQVVASLVRFHRARAGGTGAGAESPGNPARLTPATQAG